MAQQMPLSHLWANDGHGNVKETVLSYFNQKEVLSMGKRKLSMPFWCVGNPVSDPFGVAILDRIDSFEITDILCWARKEGLIDYTSTHDDDMVPWDPKNCEDDLNPKSKTSETLKKIKGKMESHFKWLLFHPSNGKYTNILYFK